MAENTRLKILAFLGLALVATFVLSAGLDSLIFEPGKPFIGGGESAPLTPTPLAAPKTSASGGQILPFIQGAAAFSFIVFLFFLVINLISAVGYKRILKSAAALAISLAILVILPRINVPEPDWGPIEPEAIGEQKVFTYPTTPLGDPPDSLIWIVMVILGAAAVGLILWFFLRRRKLKPVNRLLQEAEEAMNALQNGVDLRNVIIRCYVQMCQALQDERGIERGAAVTPHEFIELLLAKNMPEAPIRLLTRLFEKVRYGNQPTDSQDEKNAVECLSAIVAACQESAVSA